MLHIVTNIHLEYLGKKRLKKAFGKIWPLKLHSMDFMYFFCVKGDDFSWTPHLMEIHSTINNRSGKKHMLNCQVVIEKTPHSAKEPLTEGFTFSELLSSSILMAIQVMLKWRISPEKRGKHVASTVMWGYTRKIFTPECGIKTQQDFNYNMSMWEGKWFRFTDECRESGESSHLVNIPQVVFQSLISAKFLHHSPSTVCHILDGKYNLYNIIFGTA